MNNIFVYQYNINGKVVAFTSTANPVLLEEYSKLSAMLILPRTLGVWKYKKINLPPVDNSDRFRS